jgi:hypothetical protein
LASLSGGQTRLYVSLSGGQTRLPVSSRYIYYIYTISDYLFSRWGMIMKYAHKQITRSEPKYLNIYLWGSDLVKYHFSGTPPGGWNITLVICLCAYFINIPLLENNQIWYI